MIQSQVISKVLKESDASIITLNNLSEDYFSDYVNEYSFIKNHLNSYNKVPDLATFLNVFPDFPLLDVGEPMSYLLLELQKDKNKRFLAENFNKVRSFILDDNIDSAMAILKQAAEESASLVSLEPVNILEDTSRYNDYLDRINNGDKYFIKTGFSELDRLIGGWDARDELGTIVARNGIGKTWILLKAAAAAAEQGKTVGIYSGEMSENKVGYRLDTIIGHISNGALVHGNESVKTDYERFLSDLSARVPGKIFILTPKMINGPAGVSALRAFIEKSKLDILFIDQHSLLEDDRKAKNPVEKASNISKDLKILQVTTRIPIVSVSQQNREKLDGNKKFDTTQVAQSDRIAQDSSTIIFIERDADIMRLHLVKSRDNENGKILSYRVSLNTGDWIYIPDGEDSEAIENSGYSGDEVF